MRIRSALLGLVLVLVVGPAHAAPPMTIEEAVQLAQTRNERSRIAELDLVVADAGVQKARVALLPILNAGASDTLRPIDTPTNVAQAQVSINQPLVDFGAYARLTQARHQLSAQRAQSADDRRRVAFDAARAFVAVLLAEQVAAAAQRKLETARANLDDTQAHVDAQLVSSNDVTRAQISLAGATRELALDQGRLRTAYVELGLVINATPPDALTPPDKLLADSVVSQPAEQQLIADALARRTDLAARKDSALAAHDFAREPRRRYLPTLGLGAQVSATTNTPGSGHNVDGQVALNLSWSIYDGGSRDADARARDAQAEIADLEVTQMGREITADVRGAALDLASAQLALAAARIARDAARKGADEAAILYRQGLAKAIELLDANDQRFSAEVGYATAEFDVASAYISLRLALGLSPLESHP